MFYVRDQYCENHYISMSYINMDASTELGRQRPSLPDEVGRFGERLRLAIGSRSQRGVSEESGLSSGTVHNLLSGGTPNLLSAVLLADVTGVNLEWLATGQGPIRHGDALEGIAREPAQARDAGEFATAPFYDVEASCGHGAWNCEENIVNRLAFRRDWLRQEGLDPAHLAAIRARGDSMEPTIQSGDTLLVDRRVTTPRADGIYIIEQDGGLSAKRIQRAPDGTLYIRSDNPAYREIVMSPDATLNIIGRLAWFGRRTL
ncbi:MAG: helix-turn-helix transcriptional regulator [Halothiobacillaceae bacterium]|nr:MAG: helix-turn-helix transcriptional regulator [Halothiobacillaceae bacterium]